MGQVTVCTRFIGKKKYHPIGPGVASQRAEASQSAGFKTVSASKIVAYEIRWLFSSIKREVFSDTGVG